MSEGERGLLLFNQSKTHNTCHCNMVGFFQEQQNKIRLLLAQIVFNIHIFELNYLT